MSTTDVALPSERAAERTQQTNQTIGAMIQQLRPELARALPRGLDADRMARLALTVLRQTPKLAMSTPASFAGSLLTAAALGLEPGVQGEAWLVPYEDRRKGVVECQFIAGYQGLAKLFWQNPLAKHLDAQAVYEADEFDYAYGTNPFLTHKPSRAEDRGKVIYYYAVATLGSGGSSFVVLTPAEVKRLRGGKVGASGNIDDPMRWMERKTALKQLLKTMPKSTQLARALAADEEMGSSLRAQQASEAIIPHVPHTGEVIDGDVVGPVCPECQQGKHQNCEGQAWDNDADEPVACACTDESHQS